MSKRKMGLALLAAGLCVGLAAAQASDVPAKTSQDSTALAARNQVESTLLVTGSIIIGRDGSVLSHTLDSTIALGADLTKFVDESVNQWHFRPVTVDGSVVIAKLQMSLRLVATKTDTGGMSVAIASRHFGGTEAANASQDVATSARLTPPRYPESARRNGASGTVYLIAQIGRDGAVMNVAAEQVNLGVIGTSAQMAEMRAQFAGAAVRGAKRWNFRPPTTGVLANRESWLVRIPVEFFWGSESARREQASKWQTYVRGPRNKDMPWAKQELLIADSPDALPEGGIYPLQQGAQLMPSPAT